MLFNIEVLCPKNAAHGERNGISTARATTTLTTTFLGVPSPTRKK